MGVLAIVRSAEKAPVKIAGLVPTLASVSPEYRELVAKRDALWAKADAVREKMRHSPNGHNARYSDTADAAAAARLSRVARLAGDDTASAVHTPQDEPTRRLGELRSELRDLTDAIDLLDKRIFEAGSKASVLVCEQVREEHTRRVKALLVAVLAVHKANSDYTTLANAFERGGISWSMLNPTFPGFLGSPEDKNSGLWQFVLEAVADGWLSKADLPAEIRPYAP